MRSRRHKAPKRGMVHGDPAVAILDGSDGRHSGSAIAMEDRIDPEERRLGQNHYGHAQPISAPLMPPADVASLHNYPPLLPPLQPPPPPVAAMQYSSTTGWQPPPSPYESHDQRPPPQELANQPPNAAHYYAPSSREPSIYGPDPSYSRAGSISAPNRSPNDDQVPHFQPVNGNLPDSVHYQGFGPRPAYGLADPPPPNSSPPPVFIW
jgi:hypothetical protein